RDPQPAPRCAARLPARRRRADARPLRAPAPAPARVRPRAAVPARRRGLRRGPLAPDPRLPDRRRGRAGVRRAGANCRNVDLSRPAAAGAGALIATSAVVALGADAAPRPAARAATRPASPPPHYVALTVAWGGDTTLGSSYGLPPDRGRPELAAVAADLRAA